MTTIKKPTPTAVHLLAMVDRASQGRTLPADVEELRAAVLRLEDARRATGVHNKAMGKLRQERTDAYRQGSDARRDRDRLRGVLRNVLCTFIHASTEDGASLGYTSTVHPEDYASWHAALEHPDLEQLRATVTALEDTPVDTSGPEIASTQASCTATEDTDADNDPSPTAADGLRKRLAEALRDNLVRRTLYVPGAFGGGFGLTEFDIADITLTVVQPELDRLTVERDEAREGAHQLDWHRPTTWAYEQACRALDEHRARANTAEAERDDARMWARHGYEIGQDSNRWSDHGVAPAWLTETTKCCVCGSSAVTYRNYREQPFCLECSECGCGQDVCIRMGLNTPVTRADTRLPSIHTNDIQGTCPACGHPTLFIGEGGYLTCSLMDCPQPDAASTLLEGRIPEQPPTPVDAPPATHRTVMTVPCPRCAAEPLQRCRDGNNGISRRTPHKDRVTAWEATTAATQPMYCADCGRTIAAGHECTTTQCRDKAAAFRAELAAAYPEAYADITQPDGGEQP